MAAYIFFDPVYRDGRVCGAYANVTRIAPTAPAGCLNLIMREAMAKFKAELEREAAAAAKKAAGDDGGDDLAGRDQEQEEAQPAKRLSKKERLALKAAALAARGVSAEELRAQRAAKRQGQQQQQPAAAAAAAAPALNAAAKPPPPPPRKQQQQPLPPFFVSLGMAPFYALASGADADPEIPGEASATRVMRLVYEYGQTFYPYKAIAFSKTRYGGGLDEEARAFPRDRAARWRPVYVASSLDAPTFVALFDLGALVGFWKGPFEAIATFVRYEWAGLKGRVAARMAARRAAAAAARGPAARRRDESGAAVAAAPTKPALLVGAEAAAVVPGPPTPGLAPAEPVTPSFASAASAPGSVVSDVDAYASFAGNGDAAAAAKGAAAAVSPPPPRAGAVAVC
jgi:hypothetical protein